MTLVPFGNPGVAGHEYEAFQTADLLLGLEPPVADEAMIVEESQTLVINQVVGLNENNRIVPATYVGAPQSFATGALTFSDVASADETVTIGDVTYTFKATPSAANEVLVGGDAAACAANLIAAVNAAPLSETAEYGDGTVANPDASASAGAAGVVELRAKTPGQAGEVATTETLSSGAFGAATLTGGVGAGVKAIGWMAAAITTDAAEVTTKAPVIYSGHVNIDRLVWDASFNTDDKKINAFRGAPSPTQIVAGFNKFNRVSS